MFKKKKRVEVRPEPPTRPVSYPDGLAVMADTDIWYIKGGTRYRCFSPRVVESWGFKIVPGSPESLSKIRKSSAPLGFRDGTLIKDVSDGRMYLVSANKKRHITDPDVLNVLGVSEDDFIVVSSAEAQIHDDGAELSGI